MHIQNTGFESAISGCIVVRSQLTVWPLTTAGELISGKLFGSFPSVTVSVTQVVLVLHGPDCAL
jgi:hypothetical protein